MRSPTLPHRWLCLLLTWTLVWAPLAAWAGWSHPHATDAAPLSAGSVQHPHCGSVDPVPEPGPDPACPCPAEACDCLMALPGAVPAETVRLLHLRWARLEAEPATPPRASLQLQPLLRPPAA